VFQQKRCKNFHKMPPEIQKNAAENSKKSILNAFCLFSVERLNWSGKNSELLLWNRFLSDVRLYIRCHMHF
jgi:hypothetical protein